MSSNKRKRSCPRNGSDRVVKQPRTTDDGRRTTERCEELGSNNWTAVDEGGEREKGHERAVVGLW